MGKKDDQAFGSPNWEKDTRRQKRERDLEKKRNWSKSKVNRNKK